MENIQEPAILLLLFGPAFCLIIGYALFVCYKLWRLPVKKYGLNFEFFAGLCFLALSLYFFLQLPTQIQAITENLQGMLGASFVLIMPFAVGFTLFASSFQGMKKYLVSSFYLAGYSYIISIFSLFNGIFLLSAPVLGHNLVYGGLSKSENLLLWAALTLISFSYTVYLVYSGLKYLSTADKNLQM